MCIVGQSTSPGRFQARQGNHHLRLPSPVKTQAWSCPAFSQHESMRDLLQKGRLSRVRATMLSGEASKNTYDTGLHPQFTDRQVLDVLAWSGQTNSITLSKGPLISVSVNERLQIQQTLQMRQVGVDALLHGAFHSAITGQQTA